MSEAAEKTGLKFKKYYDPVQGVYPALSFLKDAAYFHPVKSLAIGNPKELKIPTINSVCTAEFEVYRQKAHEFRLTNSCDLSMDGIGVPIREVKDF